ncbi:MAG: hypothetical protein JWO28_1728, partial [Hyphomicrobiales bacterium]|nr:hypothetical protein [Hyphomicrobiales bacterium]
GENRAADMEQHAGVESLLGWIKRECADHIDAAQSWSALHQVLREHGLEMRVRGNGLVINTEDGVAVKASSVGRNYSKSRLEARLGDFEPSRERPDGKKPARQYDKTPMPSRINTVELHARYKEVQRAESASRTTDWARAAVRQKRLIEDAKRRGRLKRAAIKLTTGASIVKKILYAATSATLRDEIASINKEYLKERQAVFEKYRRRTWADWLRAQAVAGDQEALAALRAREATQGLKGNTVAGKRRPNTSGARFNQDSITKKGTIIYSAGSIAVRDDGDKLQVARVADMAGLQVALLMAMERYGDRITVNGSVEFKEQIAMAAAAARLPIRFDDVSLEARRQQLMQIDSEKEQDNEQQGATRERADRGRDARRRFVNAGAEHGRTRREEPRHGTSTPSQSPSGHAKSNVGRIGQKPPPASQNRLRELRELGVVQLANGTEVLLPGDVPNHVEQQGTKPDNGLRRNLAGTGLGTSMASTAAARYVLEREQKRLTLFDIPKHTHYTSDNGGLAAFAGIRRVDGQALALLRRDEEIMVLPIDEATARRLRKLVIGAELTVQPNGSIKATKGRSR